MSGLRNEIIELFIAQFESDATKYDSLCDKAQQLIRKLIKKKGIMAIVTSRVKDPERLKEKLYNRNADRPKKNKVPYQTMDDIFDDIPDLVGIRIALYFPDDARKIEDLLSPHFPMIPTIEFPEKVDNYDALLEKGFTAYKRRLYPTYEERRFDGYCAIHHRVKFKSSPVKSLRNVTIEIQTTSVLMHAWSEVEHDLAYKKKMGNVSREEYECLDEINGLVMAGEIALKRLNKLSQQRIQNISVFDTHYTLAAYLAEWQKKHIIGDQPLGNTEILFESYSKENCLLKEFLDSQLDYLERQGYQVLEPLADQLLDVFSAKDHRTIVKNLLSQAIVDTNNLDPATMTAAQLGNFLGKWNALEDAIKKALRKQGYYKFTRPELLQLIEHDHVLTKDMGLTYYRLRKERNKIVHGYVVPTPPEFQQLVSDIDQLLKNLKQTYGV